MGLDISFYSVKRDEVGYFRKVNFILTYFDVDKDCVDIGIDREKFAEFVSDLSIELKYRESKIHELQDGGEMPPINPKFNTCEVFFGGSTSYDGFYWADMQRVYDWAFDTLNSFDWDGHRLVLNCWW